MKDFKSFYLENFADGKKKGKSRPGRVKKSGASCNGSVTDLRKKAKNASGEKAKMYHWCANMKGGKKKSESEEVQQEGIGAIAGGIGKLAKRSLKAVGKEAAIVAGEVGGAGLKAAGQAAMGVGKAAIKGLDQAGQAADKAISKLSGDEEVSSKKKKRLPEEDAEKKKKVSTPYLLKRKAQKLLRIISKL